jgi:spore coat protein CotF
MQLTQKETMLLKDLKDQEKLCIDKYTDYAQKANDTQLKDLFTTLASTEQQHYDTLMQIEKSTPPTPSGASKPLPTFSANYSMGETPEKKNDAFLCSDVLSAEKHVSSLYDVSIFEFTSPTLRDTLGHIQKEEQNHGEQIWCYMSANGMY